LGVTNPLKTRDGEHVFCRFFSSTERPVSDDLVIAKFIDGDIVTLQGMN